MHPRGVNDLMPRKAGTRASMAQHAILLARLERRKTILETQVRLWEAKQRVVARQLRLVTTRIRNIQQVLNATKSAPQSVEGSGSPEPDQVRRHIFDFSFFKRK